jgi:adenosine deaminase
LMIAHNLSATICTDNRLVSHTTVTRELKLAAEHFDLDAAQIRNLVIAGFKGAFFNGGYTEKRAYVRQAIDQINRLMP